MLKQHLLKHLLKHDWCVKKIKLSRFATPDSVNRMRVMRL